MINFLNTLLRWIFYAVVARFIVLVIIGLNVRNAERLPKKAPAIIVANHNSHLDTLVLTNLLPLKLLNRVHPVAAADYFLKNRLMSWFSQKIIGIIPIVRNQKNHHKNPLEACHQALDKNNILIIFPEGTRGEPEQLAEFKKGIAYLAESYPHVPIIPIYMHGLGKALPKGNYLLVPFFCDVFIGEPVYWQQDKATFMDLLNTRFKSLAPEHLQHY